MNSLSATRYHYEYTSISWFHYEYTICLANWLWLSVTRIYEKFTMNTLWNHYEFTIFYTFSLRINHLFRECTISFAISLWIHSIFSNSLFFPEFTLNSLFASLFQYEYYLFREFTLNPQFFAYPLWFRYVITIKSLKIYHFFREFTVCLANSLWIHYLLRNFSLISLFFPEFTFNSISASRFEYEFTISFANSPGYHFFTRNHQLMNSLCFCEINMKSLSTSRFHYKFIVCFENLHWIQFFRQITMNSLSASQPPFEFTIRFPKSL